ESRLVSKRKRLWRYGLIFPIMSIVLPRPERAPRASRLVSVWFTGFQPGSSRSRPGINRTNLVPAGRTAAVTIANHLVSKVSTRLVEIPNGSQPDQLGADQIRCLCIPD